MTQREYHAVRVIVRLIQSIVVFLLDDRKFGLKTENIKEILSRKEIIPIPNSPPYIAGVTNYQGTLITVLSTREIVFRSPKPQTHKFRGVLVVKRNSEDIGLLVSQIVETVESRGISTQKGYIEPEKLEDLCESKCEAIFTWTGEDYEDQGVLLNLEEILNINNLGKQAKIRKRRRLAGYSAPSEEEIAKFDILGESFLEKQQKLRYLNLKDYLLFQIKDINCGVPLPLVKQVTRSTTIERDKFCIDPLLGLISYESTQIPVLNPRGIILGKNIVPEPDKGKILVVSTTENPVAISVDEISGVTKASILSKEDIAEDKDGTLGNVKKSYNRVNSSIVENIAYPVIHTHLEPFLVLGLSAIVELLLAHESTASFLNRLSSS